MAFETEALLAICENELEALQVLDMKVASALKRRLADLTSATTVADLVAGNPTAFTATDGQQLFSLDLDSGYKLIFCNSHVNPKTIGDDGRIDWSKTKRIKILRIDNQ